tara:strand:- start:202943 stop:203761 length:819 start_codon:yes stop_codon:yes gene_type:complete
VPVDTAVDTGAADVQDQTAAQDQAEMMDQTAQDSGSESFFETWAKGQEMPMGPSMLFVAGVVLAFIVIMRSLMRSSAKRKHQTRTMGDPTERIETLNQRAKGSMDPARKAMVEAEELTRRMGAVLDNKATKIEILLAEATERIAQLERANQEIPRSVSHQAQNTAAEVPNSMNASRGVCPEALDRARLDQDRVERTWIETNDQKAVPEKEPTFRIDRGFQPAPQQESPHPLTFPEQVDELATQGLNANEIANKLNRLVGEVELVLNLRRNSG